MLPSLAFPPFSALKMRAARCLRRIAALLDATGQASSAGTIDIDVPTTRRIAHDLNNVLTAISGHAQLLECDLKNCSLSQHQRLGQIVLTANRASSLVRQLLARPSKQARTLELLDLNRLIEDQLAMLRVVAGSGIELKLVAAAALKRVHASREHIERILMNIVTNARDAMNGNGTLLIETANFNVQEPTDRHHDGPPPGTYVVMAITDDGCGMDSSTKARIFQPFFTTKAEGCGQGIGLTTVYAIVKMARGHIAVNSQPGRGTAFRIFFPPAD